jgi:MoxR-like ATPase
MDGAITSKQPFMVVATQNPYEFEGTYLLPENQLDRFLMRTRLGYPNPADEARVLDLRPANHTLPELAPVLHRDDVIKLQQQVDAVRVDRSLLDYIISLANATRTHPELQVGMSPRGSLALAQAARSTAVLHGRDYAIPEDILDNIYPVCAHRIVTRNYTGDSQTDSAATILKTVIQSLKSPS